jgi:hypothetical protein
MTEVKPPKPLNWLFVNPANTDSKVDVDVIPGHSVDTTMIDTWNWRAILKRKYEFQADKPTICFWKVGFPSGAFSFPRLTLPTAARASAYGGCH